MALHNESARRVLSETGLPSDSLLFGFADPITRRVQAIGHERVFVRIGEGGEGEEFCVDAKSGEVVVVNLADFSVWHVNESPEKFLKSLEEFASRLPYGDEATDLEEREAMANDLKASLEEIDDSAFDEDPGYWYTILGDVAIGDYSGE